LVTKALLLFGNGQQWWRTSSKSRATTSLQESRSASIVKYHRKLSSRKSKGSVVSAVKLLNQPGGRHFDEVARTYDAVRIGYPAALFDDIFDYAGVPAVQRALEIGCGSGQATKSVATRGISILCIEPGPNLAELAQQNLAGFRNVRVVRSSFEEWTLEPEPFDLVFSANAIHWVNRRVRTRKTARALRPGGILAIFRSIPLRQSAVEQEIDALMGRLAVGEEPSELPKEAEFRQSGYFEEFRKHRYEGAQVYDADSYVDLLFTLQRYHRIPPEVRSERLTKVRAIVRENGGTILVRSVTHLLLARKKNQRPWWKKLFPAE
jgi:SAM-dependent methyltransferase